MLGLLPLLLRIDACLLCSKFLQFLVPVSKLVYYYILVKFGKQAFFERNHCYIVFSFFTQLQMSGHLGPSTKCSKAGCISRLVSVNYVYMHAGLRRGVLPVRLCCRTILARLLWNPWQPLVKTGELNGWVPQNKVSVLYNG